MDKLGSALIFFLLTQCLTMTTCNKVRRKINKEQARDIAATIFADYPPMKEKIDIDTLAEVLTMELEEQLAALQTVLEQTGLKLEDLDEYFTQDTTLTAELDNGDILVTNTSLIGLPSGAVADQTQQVLDSNGEPIDGTGSDFYVYVEEPENGDGKKPNNQPLDDGKVTYKGSEEDVKGSMKPVITNIGGGGNPKNNKGGNKVEGPPQRRSTIVKRSAKTGEKILSRQRRNVITETRDR